MKLSKSLKDVSNMYAELEDLCSQLLDAIKNEDMEDFMSLKEQIDEICDGELQDMLDDEDMVDMDDSIEDD